MTAEDKKLVAALVKAARNYYAEASVVTRIELMGAALDLGRYRDQGLSK